MRGGPNRLSSTGAVVRRAVSNVVAASKRVDGRAGREAQAQPVVGRAVVELDLAAHERHAGRDARLDGERADLDELAHHPQPGDPRLVPRALARSSDADLHLADRIEIAVVGVAAVDRVLDAEQPGVGAIAERDRHRAVGAGHDADVAGVDLAAVVDLVDRRVGRLDRVAATRRTRERRWRRTRRRGRRAREGSAPASGRRS